MPYDTVLVMRFPWEDRGVPWISQPVIFKFGTEYDNPTIYWLVVSALCLGKLPSFLGHPHDTQWDSQLIDDRNHQLMTNWKSDSHGYPESHDYLITSFFVSTYQLPSDAWRVSLLSREPRAGATGATRLAESSKPWMHRGMVDKEAIRMGMWGFPEIGTPQDSRPLVSILKGSSLMTWMIFGVPHLRKLPWVSDAKTLGFGGNKAWQWIHGTLGFSHQLIAEPKARKRLSSDSFLFCPDLQIQLWGFSLF